MFNKAYRWFKDHPPYDMVGLLHKHNVGPFFSAIVLLLWGIIMMPYLALHGLVFLGVLIEDRMTSNDQ